MSLQAMKQALEALENLQELDTGTHGVEDITVWTPEAITALRAAIEAQEIGWLECIPYERSCDHLDEFNEVGQAYADGWNACRKAMLQAAPKPGDNHD